MLEGAGILTIEGGNILAGPGEDAAIIKVTENLALVQTTDFFTPIVDDPYIQGKISACNSLSDAYAKGAINIAGVLAIIGFPTTFPIEIGQEILKGIKDLCQEVGTTIVGGHTVINPWPIIGAVVTAVMPLNQIVYNSRAKPGDRLILTKPLGTQSAMAAHRVLGTEFEEEVTKALSKDIIQKAIEKAIQFMITPNKSAAEVMVKIGVNAATDITGFGILGHGGEMARRSKVDMEIHTLPVIKGTIELSKLFHHKLAEGAGAETSGGLLISVSEVKKEALRKELKRRNIPAYEIGQVKVGDGKIFLQRGFKILEV